MRLFLTGATGHLGSQVALRLLRSLQFELFGMKRLTSSLARLAGAGAQIRWYNTEETPVENMLEDCRPDIVLHAATQYGPDPHGRSTLIETNVAMPLRILDAAIAQNVSAFISVGTMLEKTASAYALSKNQFREWLSESADSIRAIDIATELFYGPGGNPENFVSSLVRQLLRGDPRVPLTAGEQVRDFVIADDLVDAIEHVLRHVAGGPPGPGYQRFEVGGGQPQTIRDFAQSIQRILGPKGSVLDFGSVPYRRNEPMCIAPDLARMRAIGWLPCRSHRETILRMAEEEDARVCQNI
ncbi:MAG: NAD(P)-dependent oxidoreductase [Verrucomicrobiae bacterium]|nr:NAD(P)-dependent oxidoreductase [Verrucomicrobiae bacterium]